MPSIMLANGRDAIVDVDLTHQAGYDVSASLTRFSRLAPLLSNSGPRLWVVANTCNRWKESSSEPNRWACLYMPMTDPV